MRKEGVWRVTLTSKTNAVGGLREVRRVAFEGREIGHSDLKLVDLGGRADRRNEFS